MGSAIDEAMQKTDAYIFGRHTWKVSAAAWPQRAGKDPFADRLNAMTKYVASRTLSQEDLTAWNNSHLLPPDDALGAIAELKAREGGDIQCYGSANLAAQLIANELVDEYSLMIEPIILGGGKRLFPDDGVLRGLELVSSITSSTGVQICKYRSPTAT
jgi:dihydrofolate reductase